MLRRCASREGVPHVHYTNEIVCRGGVPLSLSHLDDAPGPADHRTPVGPPGVPDSGGEDEFSHRTVWASPLLYKVGVGAEAGEGRPSRLGVKVPRYSTGKGQTCDDPPEEEGPSKVRSDW